MLGLASPSGILIPVHGEEQGRPMPTTRTTLHVCISGIAFCSIATTPERAAVLFAAELVAAGIEVEDAPPCAYSINTIRGDVSEIVGAMMRGDDRAHREATIARL